MLSLEEFKVALGEEANNLSEDQILKVREQMDQMANILFDRWLKERNKKL